MQKLKSLISKGLQDRYSESFYKLLCNQARETTDLCTFFRYHSSLLKKDCFLGDSPFFDASCLPQRRSAIIFGSGPSALSINKEMVRELRKEYLIVGFNFASLLDITFDLYFFEAFGLSQPFEKVVDAALLLASEGTRVVFKSVWMHIYPSLKELARLAQYENFSLLRSYKLPSLSHEWISSKKAPLIYLKSLFHPHYHDNDFYKEAFSTMLTILPILKYAGVQDIHLIGCDMNQDYFFRSPDYLAPMNKALMIPTEERLPRTYNSVHVTGSQKIESVITMLPLINELHLAKLSIDGSVQGPLSNKLPKRYLSAA